MKRIFACFLAMLLAMSLAACGAEEAAPETQQPSVAETTEMVTEATTEETTEPDPLKILEPFFEEQETDPSLHTGYRGTLEVVDDATVRVNLYQEVLYDVEEVLALKQGETLGLRCGDEVYEATVLRIQEADPEKGYDPGVLMVCSGKELWLAPWREVKGSVLEGDLEQGDILGFVAVYPPSDFFEASYQSIDLAAASLAYWEAEKDPRTVGMTTEELAQWMRENKDSHEPGETKYLTGLELIQRLKDRPETIRVNDTTIWMYGGEVERIHVSVDPE